MVSVFFQSEITGTFFVLFWSDVRFALKDRKDVTNVPSSLFQSCFVSVCLSEFLNTEVPHCLREKNCISDYVWGMLQKNLYNFSSLIV